MSSSGTMPCRTVIDRETETSSTIATPARSCLGPLAAGQKRRYSGTSVQASAPTSQSNGDAKKQRQEERPESDALIAPELLETAVAAVAAAAENAALALPQLLRDLEAIVINLERRTDRMECCAARIQAYCPWLRYSKFPACDGRVTVMSEDEVSLSWNTGNNVIYQKRRALRKGWTDVESYQARQLAMSPGERGCAVSHIQAWRHCLAAAGDSDKPLLVLEDDAAPTVEFTRTLTRCIAALPEDADVLYLGYSQAAEWRRELSENLVEAEYVWTTVGYLVWPAGARKLLSRLPVDQPVDNWMATLCANGNIKAYCVRPKIILQADAWNVNSDVAHSDEHYWGPDSDIMHTGGASEVDALDCSNADGAPSRFLSGGSLLWDIDNSDDSEAGGA